MIEKILIINNNPFENKNDNQSNQKNGQIK